MRLKVLIICTIQNEVKDLDKKLYEAELEGYKYIMYHLLS